MISPTIATGRPKIVRENDEHDWDSDPRHIIPGVIARVTAIEIDREVFSNLSLNRFVEILFGVRTG